MGTDAMNNTTSTAVEEILERFGRTVIGSVYSVDDYVGEAKTEATQAIEAYVAQRVIEGRIDELQHFSDEYFQDGLWFHRNKIEERIGQLTNNMVGEE